MKIIALVPAFNESANIAATIKAIKQIDLVDQIVVIDDGSQDDTVRIAKQYPISVIALGKNSGKGQALNVGWQSFEGDIYLLIDADLKDSAIFAKELLPPVIAGDFDLSIANFIGSQIEAGPIKMGFGMAKFVARGGIKLLTGKGFNSPLSGQRAVRRQVLENCGGFAQGFGCEIALTVCALRHGYKVVEVDVPMTHRATGRTLSGFIHRGRQFLAIIGELYRAWRNQ